MIHSKSQTMRAPLSDVRTPARGLEPDRNLEEKGRVGMRAERRKAGVAHTPLIWASVPPQMKFATAQQASIRTNSTRQAKKEREGAGRGRERNQHTLDLGVCAAADEVRDCPAGLLAHAESVVLEDLEEHGHNVGVDHSLDLHGRPRSDVRNGPARLLPQSLLGVSVGHTELCVCVCGGGGG